MAVTMYTPSAPTRNALVAKGLAGLMVERSIQAGILRLPEPHRCASCGRCAYDGEPCPAELTTITRAEAKRARRALPHITAQEPTA